MRCFSTLLMAILLLAGYAAGAVCSDAKHPGITALAMRDKINPDEPLSFRWWVHFRDAIDRSARYCLVKNPSDSYVVLSVTGSDTDPQHFAEDRAAVSLAAYFTANTVFINHWLHVCGAGRIDECAETALGELDHELQSVPEALRPRE